ncbi:polyhydroxybutyrate depolymerase [Rhodophyticola sp. CCM32]|uniref:alpha/beta hydrolase family esterase n=1 Tax=Rhodophyticola sp. CCM32 TaxID=2916397 RepID=UPI00107F5174|nr:PHB depolymerase family esterase [Rhodophyticola sp. CCM32]QBY01010.1 polyhydroxybutyrate depolymerase [Rhodophyticola sp. CCM32]
MGKGAATWIAGLILACLPGALLAGCLDDPNPCEVPLGTYHLALPEGAETGLPAVMFLHGAGGTGMGAINNTGMSDTILGRGYAVIGPNGLDRPGRFGTGWYFHPDYPRARDEIAFLTQIRDDAAARFGIDADRVLLGGFSVGGSMTSYVACEAPDSFAAYAPVAGSFWRPHPESCAGPLRLLHTHGWRDRTVPLEGRPLGGGRIYQGDVWQAMQIWREVNGCDQMRADAFDTSGLFWIRRWDACTDATALEFALHPGGHGIPQGWSDLALDWFEGLEAE